MNIHRLDIMSLVFICLLLPRCLDFDVNWSKKEKLELEIRKLKLEIRSLEAPFGGATDSREKSQN